MFSGIIQNQGVITRRQKAGGQVRFEIRFRRAEKKLAVGESIAVNGVCLTVTGAIGTPSKSARFKKSAAKRTGKPGTFGRGTSRGFKVDVVKETLKATTLGALEKGDTVNLERALQFGDRIGGHFINGHVDGVGVITAIEKEGKNQLWTVKAPKAVAAQLVKKGSVAFDGISLTVQETGKDTFQIALIPHTLKNTTLAKKKEGDSVNVEVDLLSRYAGKEKVKTGPAKKSIARQIKQLQLRGF